MENGRESYEVVYKAKECRGGVGTFYLIFYWLLSLFFWGGKGHKKADIRYKDTHNVESNVLSNK